MPKVTPFLWFDDQAEEAARFYVSLFKNSSIGRIARYGDAGPGPKGSIVTIEFELDGQAFVGLNGGPHFRFTEAVSFSIDCADQAEVDFYWDRLSEGGQTSQCGWLKDRFGLSWQINYAGLPDLLSGGAERSGRVMAAMMEMKKVDIARLEAAASGT